MGLDIYVGALSRYYEGNWETIIQQISHEQGMEIHFIRATESPDPVHEFDEMRTVILNWRKKLFADLQGKISDQLKWDESREAPYFTDKPTWKSYHGLLLWAAYAEHPDLKMPSSLPDDLSIDPAYKIVNKKAQHQYDQLFDGSELWLPCDFDFTFTTVDIRDNNITIGSSKALLSQLENLNAVTWNADDRTLKDWLQVGAGHEDSLETHARFSFSVFYELTKLSVAHNLPMKLDY